MKMKSKRKSNEKQTKSKRKCKCWMSERQAKVRQSVICGRVSEGDPMLPIEVSQPFLKSHFSPSLSSASQGQRRGGSVESLGCFVYHPEYCGSKSRAAEREGEGRKAISEVDRAYCCCKSKRASIERSTASTCKGQSAPYCMLIVAEPTAAMYCSRSCLRNMGGGRPKVCRHRAR